jgi:hypothetical protein
MSLVHSQALLAPPKLSSSHCRSVSGEQQTLPSGYGAVPHTPQHLSRP